MLLEFFVHRFAQKMGKHFKKIDKRTIELFRSYSWPGNIRELQNVVERSVIVSSDGEFCVDAAWLRTHLREVEGECLARTGPRRGSESHLRPWSTTLRN
jgi:transcriptional regulator with PAS, ATPase and Fis domain